jgi:hypothetical protein
MTKEMKDQIKLADLNIRVVIAFGVLMIVGLLMYLAFFK